ncbi:hypothetical protein Zmor_012758 [Zophobas morio]|uniref:Uncharacterized protein n=1 Tax=Zophobas morio TaxID=2755281 RepID=A0AA38IBZ8_9CUCU|nr:hypothetical protein Zmor_012726 [Zophobas morio]KAJ3653510.1 hypothetical protein Zmor_012758 [Zophobas morio]
MTISLRLITQTLIRKHFALLLIVDGVTDRVLSAAEHGKPLFIILSLQERDFTYPTWKKIRRQKHAERGRRREEFCPPMAAAELDLPLVCVVDRIVEIYRITFIYWTLSRMRFMVHEITILYKFSRYFDVD